MLNHIITFFLSVLLYLFYGSILSIYHLVYKILISAILTLRCALGLIVFLFDFTTDYFEITINEFNKNFTEANDYENVFYLLIKPINIATMPLYFYCNLLYIIVSFFPKLIMREYTHYKNRCNLVQHLKRQQDLKRQKKELLNVLKSPPKVLTMEEIIKQNEIIDLSCSICLEPLLSTKSKKLECNHTFHKDCVDEWLKRNMNCPLCRTETLDIRINIPNFILENN